MRCCYFTEMRFYLQVNPKNSRLKVSCNCVVCFDSNGYNCVRGAKTQPLICVGCSVHYWVSCAINSRRRLNFRKAYIFKSLLKVYYRSVFNETSKAFIFQKCAKSLHPE